MSRRYVSDGEIVLSLEADENFLTISIFLFERTRMVGELPQSVTVDIGRHTK